LHGPSHRLAIQGVQDEINYQLVAADFVGFKPKKICE
jgi:predicted phosphohydrolase